MRGMTESMQRVLKLCRSHPGMTSREIADEIYPTCAGGETHVSNMLARLEKLGLVDGRNMPMLAWTKDKPTVEGYYWARPTDWIEGFSATQIVCVYRITDRDAHDYSLYLDKDRQPGWLVKGTGWASPSAVANMDLWFYGPLPEPKLFVCMDCGCELEDERKEFGSCALCATQRGFESEMSEEPKDD